MTQPRRAALPYAAFTRLITPVDENANTPAPIDPRKRVTRELIERLKRIDDDLANAQIDALTLFPDGVRHKLSKMLLATAEQAQKTARALVTFDTYGTLMPPGAKPAKKSPRARS